jgi:hypothetical protein
MKKPCGMKALMRFAATSKCAHQRFKIPTLHFAHGLGGSHTTTTVGAGLLDLQATKEEGGADFKWFSRTIMKSM